ncbi:MAG TPA: hypothetical protein DEP45_14680 [Armatimonadetes bacterium]|nr:hypothetical protein [Armatimonadota bacterium]
MLEAHDFGRSFATFVTKGRTNHARIQFEATCELAGGAIYALVASCKSEDTYAERNLFKQPNYDFCAIFGPEQYCIVRVGLPVTAAWLESGLSSDRFEEVRIAPVQAEAEVCADRQAVVEATLANRPLVGRTQLLGEAGEMIARVEYPIKTMNVNDSERAPSGDWIFQIDTGPIVVPAERKRGDLAVEGLELAFIAWNAPDWAEFVVLEPTRIGHTEDCVGHYSRVRVVSARNEVLALR